jgi:hypothetical protein
VTIMQRKDGRWTATVEARMGIRVTCVGSTAAEATAAAVRIKETLAEKKEAQRADD